MLLPQPEEWTADIRSRLTTNHISYSDLAEEYGVHASGMSRWLTNKVEPRLSTMHGIESALTALLARGAAEALV